MLFARYGFYLKNGVFTSLSTMICKQPIYKIQLNRGQKTHLVSSKTNRWTFFMIYIFTNLQYYITFTCIIQY